MPKDHAKCTTFVMDKKCITECINFLCQETRIETNSVDQNGFTVYDVPHFCNQNSYTVIKSPILSNLEEKSMIPWGLTNRQQNIAKEPAKITTSNVTAFERSKLHIHRYEDSCIKSTVTRLSSPASVEIPSNEPLLEPQTATSQKYSYYESFSSSSSSTNSLDAPLFQPDESLKTNVGIERANSAGIVPSLSSYIPPRNIPRVKHTSFPATPVSEFPPYYNLQPPLPRDSTMRSFSAGEQPRDNKTFHLLNSVPLPPRKVVSTSGMQNDDLSYSNAAAFNKAAEGTLKSNTPRVCCLPKCLKKVIPNSPMPKLALSQDDSLIFKRPSKNILESCQNATQRKSAPLLLDQESFSNESFFAQSEQMFSDIDSIFSSSSSLGNHTTAQFIPATTRPLWALNNNAPVKDFPTLTRTVSVPSLDQNSRECRPKKSVHFPDHLPTQSLNSSQYQSHDGYVYGLEDTGLPMGKRKLNHMDASHLTNRDCMKSLEDLRYKHAKISKHAGLGIQRELKVESQRKQGREDNIPFKYDAGENAGPDSGYVHAFSPTFIHSQSVPLVSMANKIPFKYDARENAGPDSGYVHAFSPTFIHSQSIPLVSTANGGSRSLQCTPISSAIKPELHHLPEFRKSRSNSTESSSGDSEDSHLQYVHKFITPTDHMSRKINPAPLRISPIHQHFDNSLVASMVTMDIRRSKSEENFKKHVY